MSKNFIIKVDHKIEDGKADIGHYYHMMADLVFPLYHQYLTEKTIQAKDTVYIPKKSNLMEKLTSLLPFNIELYEEGQPIPEDCQKLKWKMGFPQRKVLFTHELALNIKNEIFKLNGITPNANPNNILIIQRSVPKTFLPSKNTNSGANRRSIGNFKKLYDLLESNYGDTVVYTSLEDLTVKEQCELFNNANVLIGLHGAALVNSIFMKPNSTIVEIASVALPFFMRCSEVMKHKHLFFPQRDEQSPINSPLFLKFFKQHFIYGSQA